MIDIQPQCLVKEPCDKQQKIIILWLLFLVMATTYQKLGD